MNAQELKAWRKARKLTQEELGAHLGVTRRTVIAWESSETPIPRMALLALDTTITPRMMEAGLGALEAMKSAQMDGDEEVLVRVIYQAMTAARAE